MLLSHPCLLQFVQGDILFGCWCEVVFLFLHPMIVVNLVEDNHRWLISTAKFRQSLVDYLYLFLKVRM